MKRFKFGLEVILKIRENKEEEARIALGKITAEGEKIRRDIFQHKQLLSTTALTSSIGDFQAVEFYRNRLDAELHQCENDLNRNEKERKKAKERYIYAVCQLQIYQKLKERGYQDYRKKVALEEIKLLDESNRIQENSRGMIYGR